MYIIFTEGRWALRLIIKDYEALWSLVFQVLLLLLRLLCIMLIINHVTLFLGYISAAGVGWVFSWS